MIARHGRWKQVGSTEPPRNSLGNSFRICAKNPIAAVLSTLVKISKVWLYQNDSRFQPTGACTMAPSKRSPNQTTGRESMTATRHPAFRLICRHRAAGIAADHYQVERIVYARFSCKERLLEY